MSLPHTQPVGSTWLLPPPSAFDFPTPENKSREGASAPYPSERPGLPPTQPPAIAPIDTGVPEPSARAVDQKTDHKALSPGHLAEDRSPTRSCPLRALATIDLTLLLQETSELASHTKTDPRSLAPHDAHRRIRPRLWPDRKGIALLRLHFSIVQPLQGQLDIAGAFRCFPGCAGHFLRDPS